MIDILPMHTHDQLRHQRIRQHLANSSATSVGVNVVLWEQMAAQIISIVGEGGFKSLFARSVFLSQKTFPWLNADKLSSNAEHRFADFQVNLEQQPIEVSEEANCLLLINFTDILASLIGEQLTCSLLRSAWCMNASDKELTNEQ